jgi:hypothetical protein
MSNALIPEPVTSELAPFRVGPVSHPAADALNPPGRAISVAAIIAVAAPVILTIIDIAFRTGAAWNNTNFIQGDTLAPFSLLDLFYHHQPVDLSRQPWLLPYLLSLILRVVDGHLGYRALFGAYGVTTALAASLCVPCVFVIARRFVGRFEALIPALLLSANTSFFIASVYPNPTQLYALCVTLVTLLLLYLDRRPTLFAAAAMLTAALGVLIRWEGALPLAMVTVYLAAKMRRGKVPIAAGIATYLGVAVLLVLALIFQFTNSSTPFAFLHNTNAVPASAVTQWSIGHVADLLVQSLSWKFEKISALSLNLTIFGVILAGIGAVEAAECRSVVLFAVIYWIGYEAVMFVFTLLQPITSDYYLLFHEQLNTVPASRYYEVLTPALVVLGYLGARRVFALTSQLGLFRAVLAIALVALYVLHQVTVTRTTYVSQYWSYARQGLIADFVAAAEFFRRHDIHDTDIAMAKANGTELEYVDMMPSGVPSYALHTFHFSILSGHNRTNCTGYNLDNPNLFCSVLAKSKIVALDALPLGGRVDYLLLLRPWPDTPPLGFQRVWEGDLFQVLQRK